MKFLNTADFILNFYRKYFRFFIFLQAQNCITKFEELFALKWIFQLTINGILNKFNSMQVSTIKWWIKHKISTIKIIQHFSFGERNYFILILTSFHNLHWLFDNHRLMKLEMCLFTISDDLLMTLFTQFNKIILWTFILQENSENFRDFFEYRKSFPEFYLE